MRVLALGADGARGDPLTGARPRDARQVAMAPTCPYDCRRKALSQAVGRPPPHAT